MWRVSFVHTTLNMKKAQHVIKTHLDVHEDSVHFEFMLSNIRTIDTKRKCEIVSLFHFLLVV